MFNKLSVITEEKTNEDARRGHKRAKHRDDHNLDNKSRQGSVLSSFDIDFD